MVHVFPQRADDGYFILRQSMQAASRPCAKCSVRIAEGLLYRWEPPLATPAIEYLHHDKASDR